MDASHKCFYKIALTKLNMKIRKHESMLFNIVDIVIAVCFFLVVIY